MMAPKTSFGITFRNLVTRLFRIPILMDFFLGRELRDEIQPLDYGF